MLGSKSNLITGNYHSKDSYLWLLLTRVPQYLSTDDIEQGQHVCAVGEVDDIKLIVLVYRAKSDQGKKSKRKKMNFIRYFIATDCVTTISGVPAEKKQHCPDGTIAPSKFIPQCKFVETYYEAMPASDIANRNAQFLLGIEEAHCPKH
eukprot:7684864-Ditylum_brightwellii.AAC.3